MEFHCASWQFAHTGATWEPVYAFCWASTGNAKNAARIASVLDAAMKDLIRM